MGFFKFKNIIYNNSGNLGSCINCNLKYEIEPGFWYGAMYVSYALTVFLAILVWLIMYVLNNDIDVFSTPNRLIICFKNLNKEISNDIIFLLATL